MTIAIISAKINVTESYNFYNYYMSLQKDNVIRAAPCENVPSGICGQRRPRSDCADVQSDLGLPCPLTKSLDTTECMNGEKRPR